MMTADASPKLLILSFAFLVVAFLVISGVAIAALVPLLQCANHDQDQQFEEPCPCLECNGYGRSTLFQRWNTLRYERLRESTFIKL